MCGRLVNLDTVARVLAEYYHLKTDTQLAALDEALSKVPAVSVGGGHGKDHVADPGKMVGDLISRQAAIDKFEPWLKVDGYSEGELNMLKAVLYELRVMPPAQRWIPWDSGKFPKESGTYTVTAYDGATKRVTYAKYQKRLKRWELTGARAYWRVLAWMEKPEPWKGGKE
jgi:hypothetical protein